MCIFDLYIKYVNICTADSLKENTGHTLVLWWDWALQKGGRAGHDLPCEFLGGHGWYYFPPWFLCWSRCGSWEVSVLGSNPHVGDKRTERTSGARGSVFFDPWLRHQQLSSMQPGTNHFCSLIHSFLISRPSLKFLPALISQASAAKTKWKLLA